MIRKRAFACIASLITLFAILAFLSRLTMPKYVVSSREGNLISEYYRATDRGECHDIVFIGDCEAYSSFSPPVLWEEYRFTSFIRGSPSQNIAQSYHILCETLEYETPELIVFSVYGLCREGGSPEAYNRMTLDAMRPSVYKARAVRDSIGREESALSYFLPLLRFHSRWSELCGEDVKCFFNTPSVSHNGYFLRSDILSGEFEDNAGECAPYHLPKDNLEYLEKMRQKCAEKGTALVLVKAPTSSWRYPWYAEWSDEIERYASLNSLKYYDLTRYTEDIGIDPTCDSYDGGLHLNVFGAEKTTHFFGEILRRHISVSHTTDEEKNWNKKLERYYNERNKNDQESDYCLGSGACAGILPGRREYEQ